MIVEVKKKRPEAHDFVCMAIIMGFMDLDIHETCTPSGDAWYSFGFEKHSPEEGFFGGEGNAYVTEFWSRWGPKFCEEIGVPKKDADRVSSRVDLSKFDRVARRQDPKTDVYKSLEGVCGPFHKNRDIEAGVQLMHLHLKAKVYEAWSQVRFQDIVDQQKGEVLVECTEGFYGGFREMDYSEKNKFILFPSNSGSASFMVLPLPIEKGGYEPKALLNTRFDEGVEFMHSGGKFARVYEPDDARRLARA